ncbi:hypothetical protein [Pseudomonas sp. CGJS7]|uniref:hypothetical protein n=1 Tax=Pseudomonas sp. CGJS7 TaxID=3109348 RepID=UPI00300836DF
MPHIGSPARTAAQRLLRILIASTAGFALNGCGLGENSATERHADAEPAPVSRRAFARTEDLTGYRWQVLLASDANGNPISLLQPDAYRRINVEFIDKRMLISGGFNAMQGQCTVATGRIDCTSMQQTEAGVNDDRLTAMDAALVRHVAPPYRYRVEGQGVRQRWFLTTRDGSELILQTVDAPYGHPGRRLYLQASGERRDCGQPGSPGRLCPWVREVEPDVHGQTLRVRSQWRPFTAPIDGYSPESGKHELLTLRHYPPISALANSPGNYALERREDLNQNFYRYVVDAAPPSGQRRD